MRPGQQNRRMRGRGSNRKGPNPLTRNYESNGPDVKIRGSAQQVADKYTTLARDAQSSGDRVMGENYLQHAEHYNRIIAAAQAQMPPQQSRDDADDGDGDGDDDGDGNEAQQQNERRPDRNERRPERNERRPERPERAAVNDGSGPQPEIDGVPVEVAIEQESAAAKPTRKPRQRPSLPEGASGAEGGSEEAGDGEASPKRGRRTYKTRAKRDDQEKPSDDGDDSDPVLEAAQ